MTKKVDLNDTVTQEMEGQLPPYESPRVVTYRDDDLLAELGPAQACSFSHSVVGCATPLLPWEDPWQVP
jgi:hypothetical protein